MPTKQEAEKENEELRGRLEVLEAQLQERGLRLNPNGVICAPELGPNGLTKCGNCDCGRP